jgi:elongation factor 2
MKGAQIKVGRPVVSFCETVTKATESDMIAKSPNKHNRIYLRAEPLGLDLVKAIDEKEITEDMDKKLRARRMADEFKWDIGDARKVWSFGCPPDGTANCIVDMTKAVQYMAEIKDSCCSAFQQGTLDGIICGEALRGVRFNITDCVMHADSIHRGAGQIMPPVKRAMAACQMKSGAALLEPMYTCDITVPVAYVAGVYSTLNGKRGVIEGKEDRPGTPLTKIKAFLPVLESFGFTQLLRQNTSGQAFPQMIFSHWALLNGDPFDETSQTHAIVKDVRSRKGLKEELPDFNDYYDKL